jgi:hypothetical protein
MVMDPMSGATSIVRMLPRHLRSFFIVEKSGTYTTLGQRKRGRSCKLFNLEANKAIKFVDNRPFNDQRYFLDDEKLKSLGWSERTHWEDGLRKTMEWYVANSNYWGDVSGALLPHPKAMVMPGGCEGSKEIKGMLAQFNNIQTEVAPTSDSVLETHPFKFLIYGRTGWIGGSKLLSQHMSLMLLVLRADPMLTGVNHTSQTPSVPMLWVP